MEMAAGHAGPDDKVIVRIERNCLEWQPLEVTFSLIHHVLSDWFCLSRLVEAAVEHACNGYPIP